jgi:hypothetical protein
LVEFLARKFDLKSFFEGGTYFGESSAWAAQQFEKVYTVEASPMMFSMARVKLGRYRNISLLFGDSREHLTELAPGLPATLFWLDAHWSGGHTAGENDQCPLLDELAIIAPDLDRHFVLIDDARLFAMPPPLPCVLEAWPSLADIFDALRTHHQPYIALYRDAIIVVPDWAKPGLVEFFRQDQAAEDHPALEPNG